MVYKFERVSVTVCISVCSSFLQPQSHFPRSFSCHSSPIHQMPSDSSLQFLPLLLPLQSPHSHLLSFPTHLLTCLRFPHQPHHIYQPRSIIPLSDCCCSLDSLPASFNVPLDSFPACLFRFQACLLC